MLDIDDIAVMWLKDDMELAYTMFKHSKVGKSSFKRALVRNAIKLRKIVDEDVSLSEHKEARIYNQNIWERLQYMLTNTTYKSTLLSAYVLSKIDVGNSKTHKYITKIKYKGRVIAQANFFDPELTF